MTQDVIRTEQSIKDLGLRHQDYGVKPEDLLIMGEVRLRLSPSKDARLRGIKEGAKCVAAFLVWPLV